MQLSPRYGDDPVIVLDGPPDAVVEPLVRQRRRLAAVLAELTDEQWAHPSRCEGWSARDVVVHLESTNTFWTYSVTSGLAGEPTEFLATFDPVASPAELVEASDADPAELVEAFAASADALAEVAEGLDGDDWDALAEAPPGHIPVSAVLHHALWDSWVHERDVLLPLGVDAEVAPDEVAACLRYGVGLGPGLGLNQGVTGHGVLGVRVTDPDLDLSVAVGDRVTVHDGPVEAVPDLVLEGDAVEVLEALSMRRPLTQDVPDDLRWLVGGLALQFDAE